MARAWVYDRTKDKSYNEAVKKAKAARRTPPARWLVRYYDPSGKLKSAVTYKKKPDAEKRQSDIEASLHEGVYRDPSDGRTTFGEMAEKWLITRTDIKRSTWWKYRGLLDLYLLSRWGDLPLSAIHSEDIAVWIAEMQRPREEGGANLGASQTRHVHSILSMVLGWCVPRRIPFNPAKGVPLPKPSEAEHVYLNHHQVEALANASAALRTSYDQVAAGALINRPLILLLAYTGLRFNEAAALRVGGWTCQGDASGSRPRSPRWRASSWNRPPRRARAAPCPFRRRCGPNSSPSWRGDPMTPSSSPPGAGPRCGCATGVGGSSTRRWRARGSTAPG